jgi:predicted transglutaminase-like cysteine proteinase
MTKRVHLVREGIPSGALRVAYTRTTAGQPHAILVVKTSAGDFVLDNLSGHIRPLSRTGYRVLRISTADLKQWTD